MTVIGWALAVLVPSLIVGGIVADARAQAAHDRYMEHFRRGVVGQEGESRE